MQQNNTGTTELPDRDNSAVSQDKSLSLHSTQLMFDSTHETNSPLDFNNVASKMFCVKKGVLWQQQDYGKFHQRLFSRWKKRFFILTTDHLVCFKRSTSKIGASKMGPFLHQVSFFSSASVFCVSCGVQLLWLLLFLLSCQQPIVASGPAKGSR